MLGGGVWILLMMQVPDRDRKRAHSIVPSVGVVMAACCGLLYLVPEWKAFVFEGNRLAGFFQYSNTMALYLLIGLLIFLWEEYVEPEEKGREKRGERKGRKEGRRREKREKEKRRKGERGRKAEGKEKIRERKGRRTVTSSKKRTMKKKKRKERRKRDRKKREKRKVNRKERKWKG